MYETPDGEDGFYPLAEITTFDDRDGGIDVVVTNEGDCDDGPLFSIAGVLTLAQLHELTHRLTGMIAPKVTFRQTAEWARGETLSLRGADADTEEEG